MPKTHNAMIKALNQAVLFILEMIMLYAFFAFGYSMGETLLWRCVWAILLTGTVIAVWAVYAAPKSARRLSMPGLGLLRGILLLASSCLLYRVHHHMVLAVTTAIPAVVTQFLSYRYEK